MKITTVDLIKLFVENEGHNFTLTEIKRKLKVIGEEEISNLCAILSELELEGFIISLDDYYSAMSKYPNLDIGKIRICSSGDGSVTTKNGGKIFIRHDDLNTALDGDIVIVDKQSNTFLKENEGFIRKIVKRKTNDIVFICRNNRLEPILNNVGFPIKLSNKDMKDIKEGDCVLVSIENQCVDGFIKGIVIKKIGNKDNMETNLDIIALRNGFNIERSDEIKEQIKQLPKNIPDEMLDGCVDLTDKVTFTIDCDDTQDMDDALSIDIDEDGNFVLGVHIAAVSSFVPVNSPIFRSAYQNATSVYLPGKTFHMLPEELSQGLCSLNQNEIRLTNTYEMIYDKDGNFLFDRMYKSYINSRKKMKYSEVSHLLNDNIIPSGYEPYVFELVTLQRLSEFLERQKKKRGYLNFADYEVKVNQNESLYPVSFKKRDVDVANKIIENCMLEANSRTAERFNYLELPFIYRVHDCPDEDRITKVLDIVHSLGYRVNHIQNSNNPLAIQNILVQLSKVEEFPILSNVLLRGMKKARWSTENIGHYGLSLDYYAQITSPIRRFTDLANQHLTIDYMDGKIYYNTPVLDHSSLADIAERASKQERNADIAEEEANKLNMAIYMQQHIGEYFNGIITDINEYGVFVRTIDNISGRVAFHNINGGRFVYDKESYSMLCHRNGQKYRIGDYVRLKVSDACPEMLSVDFQIKEKIGKKEKPKTLSKILTATY